MHLPATGLAAAERSTSNCIRCREQRLVAGFGHGDSPSPAEATYSEMIRGTVDCRLVKVRAVVRSAEFVPSSILLLPATALRMLVDGEQVDVEVGGNDLLSLASDCKRIQIRRRKHQCALSRNH